MIATGTILNLIGLILNLIGGLKLFTGIISFRKIEQIDLRNLSLRNQMAQIENLFKKINEEIDRTNKLNAEYHRKSIKWLWCVAIGMVLQILSLFCLPTTTH